MKPPLLPAFHAWPSPCRPPRDAWRARDVLGQGPRAAAARRAVRFAWLPGAGPVRTAVALLAAALICTRADAAPGDASTSLADRRDAATAQFAAQLEALASWCDQQALPAEADRARAWIVPRDPWKVYLFRTGDAALAEAPSPAAEAAGTANASAGAQPAAADAAAQFAARFAELRRGQAERLWTLAREAASGGQAGLAYELLLETLRENPDHAEARRVDGYVRYDNHWLTPFEVAARRAGRVWHPRFGWLAKGHVARYEAGERLVDGRWRTIDDDAARHREIQSGWLVETEHFEILTNHSLAAGVALGVRLEDLHWAWRHVFADYYLTPAQVARAFQGGPPPRRTQRHQVVYFRDREQYQQALRKAASADIGITTGIYLGDTRRAYFFVQGGEPADPAADDDGTLFHEATHQLFGESRSTSPQAGRQANFWVIEGVACYMESLTRHDGFWTLGGYDAVRLRDARHRLLESRFYVPFAELAAYGMLRLQHDPQIAKLYSQSAGLVHCLMHADRGRQRPALVGLLAAVYAGRDAPDTLASLVGTSPAALDRGYAAFLERPADSTP